MAHPTDMEIDSLFFDEVEMVIDSQTNFLDKPFPFTSLPAELRNMVYEYYVDDYTTANMVLRINVLGKMSTPAIVSVSKGVREETIGYLGSCLQQMIKKKGFRIQAKIKDYDFAPLQDRLTSLSHGNDNLRESLSRMTAVTFIGGFNMANINTWINGNPTHYKHSCFFREIGGGIPDVLNSHLFGLICGTLSLTVIVDTYRCTPATFWKSRALHFLSDVNRVVGMYSRDRSRELLRGKRMDLGHWEELDSRNSREKIGEVVFEVVARWHYYLRTVVGKGKGRNKMLKKILEEELVDMEMAVWGFVTECFRLEGV